MSEVATVDQPKKRTMSMAEFCGVMGISTRHGYEMARKGEVRVIYIGQRMLVPNTEPDRLLAGAKTE